MLRPSAPMIAIHTRQATDRKYESSVNGATTKNSTASPTTAQRATGSGYSPMSASYVVLRTPHSRWITSDPLDDLLAEDPVGANHQGHDHQHVGREVLGAAPDVRVDVARGHVLDDTHDEAADDRAGNRVQPTQDHHREHLEADQ